MKHLPIALQPQKPALRRSSGRSLGVVVALLIFSIHTRADEPQPVPNPDQTKEQIEAGTATPEQIASAAAVAIRLQADDAIPWDKRWGQFMELARKKGLLGDDLWRDYLLGSLRFEVRVAHWAKRKNGIMIYFDQKPARTGGAEIAAEAVGTREDDLSGIPTLPNKYSRRMGMNLYNGGGSGLGWGEDLNDKHYAKLKPGPQTYHYRYQMRVYEKVGDDPEKLGKLLGEKNVEGSVPWQLLADDDAPRIPALQPNPELRAQVQKAFGLPYILRDDRDKTLVEAMIQADHPATNMAFDLAVRAGGQIWPAGPVAWAKGKMDRFDFRLDLPADLTHADLVLTPSAKAVADLAENWRRELTGVDAIWDGPPIVIANVKIQTQRLGVGALEPPEKEDARKYALTLLDPNDPAAQALKRGDVQEARTQLMAQATQHPREASPLFALGCVFAAEGDYSSAMNRFVEAQNLDASDDLRLRIRKEQRRISSVVAHLAESGQADAMELLGEAYERGWGVSTILEEAKHWYRNAANAGNAGAMCRLAAIYDAQLGASVHTAEADQWYHSQAREWYRKSAGLGCAEAKEWLTSHPQ